MALERIIFWRHGETDANRGWKIQGAIDIPLNERGLSQARGAACELEKLHPTKIYASNLTRAQQTAHELELLTGLEVTTDPRLSERSYGCWEGLTADDIKISWHAEWEQWRMGNEPGLDIETRDACGERVADAVLDAVRQAQEDSSNHTLLFTSHGGAISCAISVLLGLNPSTWQGLRVMDNCHWAMLIPRPGANPQWRVVMYNRWFAQTSSIEYSWDK